MLFDFLTLHSLGLCAWSAHIPPASGTHGNHLWHFLKYNENTIIFETLTIVRENLTFLPRQQVDQRNCNSITGNQGIPDKKNRHWFMYNILFLRSLLILMLWWCWGWGTYKADGFLKASGWMELMLSPLSHVILARLAFLTCDMKKRQLNTMEEEFIFLSIGIYYLTIHWKLWYKDVDGLKITGTKLTPT